MLNTKKIEQLRKQNNFNQNDFAKLLDISTNTYQNLVKSRDFRAKTLEIISEKFNVPISYLFDEELKIANELSEPVETYGLKKENQLLKNRVKDLEKIIELLEKKQ